MGIAIGGIPIINLVGGEVGEEVMVGIALIRNPIINKDVVYCGWEIFGIVRNKIGWWGELNRGNGH